ncbi:NADH:flavin oxidoreductase/NADH oxidase (plasmid) [Nicoliella spurrieriana]|uniref:NADH:flavin oxidoreductase/NADH oxidase n=1 Tax=Nicoliella spurrieriana TaxID=2925830 RepID=A0A976RQW5_9LACO|nr:NADH:flavin oxidoreductase/NADH oxidase [Nicoliella spurrieriana]UQS86179.1 NADH:flavin oxidoreductase/NADH oxidase [Nicoliella spurrieriana]
MSLLLSPVKIANLELNNRVVMSPMCMYSVQKRDGVLEPFHFVHYGARALAKVGMVITEATAVLPNGRISDRDLGLWNEEQADKLSELVDWLHSFGTKVGVQLNHAGRKAEDAEIVSAPSLLQYSADYSKPHELDRPEIKEIKAAFVKAAERAQRAGVDMLEIHGAHGYLLDQFLSALTNHRTDEYGGSLKNRYRLVHEIVTEIRARFNGSLWIRLSLTDYDETGVQNTIDDWKQVGKWLEADGIDLIDVSTGGLINKAPNLPVHDGYQTPFATELKAAVSIPVSTVGLLDNPGLCEYILQNHQADLILEGRALLRNTNWLSDAAKQLHDHDFKAYNGSYQRGQK